MPSKKKSKIPISLELWNTLANHASEVSKKIGRTVSVDEYAEACLIYGLDDKVTLENAIKEAKKRQTKC